MSETEENTTIIIFGKFGIPKSVFYGLLSAMILGAISLSFAFVKTTAQTNKEFPDEQKKAMEVDQKANSLRIDVEVMKRDVSNVVQSVTDVKKVQEKQTDLLIEILKNSRQIKENTK